MDALFGGLVFGYYFRFEWGCGSKEAVEVVVHFASAIAQFCFGIGLALHARLVQRQEEVETHCTLDGAH